MNQIEHTLLAALREVFLHIELTDSLAQDAAHGTYGTLPARTILLNTAHHLAQLEGYGTEVIAQLVGGSADNLSLSICLQVVERLLCENLFHLMDRLWLSDANLLEWRETGS